MEHPPFDTTWLKTRFRFDEAARYPPIDHACRDYLAKFPAPTLLDIGAGLGANFLHCFEHFPADQSWYFLDWDERLLEASLERIVHWVLNQGGRVLQREKTSLVLEKGSQQLRIQTIVGSFEEVEHLVDLARVDLVMASAFFDLFTVAQLSRFLEKVYDAGSALLLTLNYDSMHFSPERAEDARVISWYEAHMQRPQVFGTAMGPHGSQNIAALLQQMAWPFQQGPSNWQVQASDQELLRFLFHFMKTAIGELTLDTQERQVFDQWWKDKQTQLAAQELHLEVRHYDFFAAAPS